MESHKIFVKQFRTGGDRNFGYLAAEVESRKALVIDPSYAPESIAAFASEHSYSIAYVFCTHGHSDHVEGNTVIKDLTGRKALLFGDREETTGTVIDDGARLPLGSLTVRIIHTPGHTDDSLCLHVGDALFTGDTLFVGKVGGTWSEGDAEREFLSLHEKLMKLRSETRVFPGHDYGTAPESTIGKERATNPFLLQPDLKSFKDLKSNWAEYKKKHGIA
jgi:glyoxylase-like metal-dependent hydrolase (beta-lactamase superfamily II)